MRPPAYLIALGAGGGLLVAAFISVLLNGPGWPYFLVLGCLSLALGSIILVVPERAQPKWLRERGP
jgi:hypothetical protein